MTSGERRLAEQLEPTQGGDPLPIHAARRLRRTTCPKAHYRNARQILQTASLVAADLLTADEKNDEGIPLLKPVSCGREGQAPVIIKLPTLRDEAFAIAGHLASTHKEGFAWGDMAVLCADWKTMDLCAKALQQRKLPHRVRKKNGEYRPGADAIQVMTMKVSKGLEFPVVALPGVGHMPAAGEDEKEAARVFYVAATRATHKLMITVRESLHKSAPDVLGEPMS
jgi:superfamily I DNA/RNA helicase